MTIDRMSPPAEQWARARDLSISIDGNTAYALPLDRLRDVMSTRPRAAG